MTGGGGGSGGRKTQSSRTKTEKDSSEVCRDAPAHTASKLTLPSTLTQVLPSPTQSAPTAVSAEQGSRSCGSSGQATVSLT